jgi:hypothetical protein
MREASCPVHGKPLRVLYAFNPKRTAILLVGGDKTGDDRWYEIHVRRADKLYDRHVEERNKRDEQSKRSKKEGSQHG